MLYRRKGIETRECRSARAGSYVVERLRSQRWDDLLGCVEDGRTAAKVAGRRTARYARLCASEEISGDPLWSSWERYFVERSLAAAASFCRGTFCSSLWIAARRLFGRWGFFIFFWVGFVYCVVQEFGVDGGIPFQVELLFKRVCQGIELLASFVSTASLYSCFRSSMI